MTKIRLDAKGWRLYADMKGSEKAARRLNAAYNSLVAEGYMRLAKTRTPRQKIAEKVRDGMFTAMTEQENFGAMDTVPRELLIQLIEKEFGVEINMLS